MNDQSALPHQNEHVIREGAAPSEAKAALIMLHGRGASAESILALADELETEGVALLAPQAEGNVWYPQSFLGPREANQKGIDGAFSLISSLLAELEESGIQRERVMLLGFSQGACLALDYLLHHPGRYGGAFALSGGLIGPPGTPFEAAGSLGGTPVFLGCSDTDPFIPAERVIESHEALQAAGARSEMQLYPGMPHTVNADEITLINARIREITVDVQDTSK
jgi:predicted esterase